MVIHERYSEEAKTKKFLEILIKDIPQFLSYFVLFPHIMVYKCIPYWALQNYLTYIRVNLTVIKEVLTQKNKAITNRKIKCSKKG